MGNGAGLDLRGLETLRDRRRYDLQVAGVADPAFLPLIIERRILAAVMVDEVGGVRGNAEQPRRRLAVAHEDRGRAVADTHLERACRPGAALVGRDDERFAAAPQRRDQRRAARALARRHVERGDLFV